MDQHVSEQSPVRYRSVLLEMRRDAPPGLNMLYLSGLAETLALIDRKNAQEPKSHDLNVGAIARVLRAWGDFEGDTWAGGFVVELLDGRRVYIERLRGWSRLGARLLCVGGRRTHRQHPAKAPKNHGSNLYGWIEHLP